MNFRWFGGLGAKAFSHFSKPRAITRQTKLMRTETTNLMAKTSGITRSNMLLLNLTTLLQKKSTISQELEGLVSMVLGYTIQEGNIFSRDRGKYPSIRQPSQIISVELLGLTVKMNATLPISNAQIKY